VTAIFAEDDVPGDRAEFTKLNVDWYTDKAAVRARVNEIQPA
jgi:hypothetical protein